MLVGSMAQQRVVVRNAFCFKCKKEVQRSIVEVIVALSCGCKKSAVVVCFVCMEKPTIGCGGGTPVRCVNRAQVSSLARSQLGWTICWLLCSH
jgi:hypothetical protein